MMVMIDDPVISTNLAELLLQVQSGLTMGFRNAGMTTPGSSLLGQLTLVISSYAFVILMYVLTRVEHITLTYY